VDTINCPGCGAPTPPGTQQCAYCGQYLRGANELPSSPQDKAVPQQAWTQGISPEGFSNGSYDNVNYTAMPFRQAVSILDNLPIPLQVADPGDYCPPSLGFGERTISRTEDGRYFLFPEDRHCTVEEAHKILLQIYESNPGDV
jgi:hypothetical protein